MDKLEYAKSLLNHIGMPQKQQGVLCALALLAMAGLKRDAKWSEATNEWIRIHDIIRFIAETMMLYMQKTLVRLSVNRQCIHFGLRHL